MDMSKRKQKENESKVIMKIGIKHSQYSHRERGKKKKNNAKKRVIQRQRVKKKALGV